MTAARMSDESMDEPKAEDQAIGTDVELVSLLDGEDDDETVERDILDAKEARKESREGRCIPHEEVKRRHKHGMENRVDGESAQRSREHY